MRWRGLLVSVRDAAEAAEALAGGASIIDVKEPLAGPLGAAGPETTAAVAAAVWAAASGRVPWTIACGELSRGTEQIIDHLQRTIAAVPAGVGGPAAVKVGLAGMAATAWRSALDELDQGLPAGPERIAVAYADWQTVGAPPPEEVIAAAAATGGKTLLVDTADKSSPGLLARCGREMIGGWIAQARAAGMQVALAGGVALEEIPAVAALGPDVVALRSAVCSNGRLGSVQRRLVRRAAEACGPDGPGSLLSALDSAFGGVQR
jgi:uncharacterized protein (UPF0264 family)